MKKNIQKISICKRNSDFELNSECDSSCNEKYADEIESVCLLRGWEENINCSDRCTNIVIPKEIYQNIFKVNVVTKINEFCIWIKTEECSLKCEANSNDNEKGILKCVGMKKMAATEGYSFLSQYR